MRLERSSHLYILAIPTHQTIHFKSASLVSENTIVPLGESSEISAFPYTVVYSASAVKDVFFSWSQRMLPILICIRVSFCSVSQECWDAKKKTTLSKAFVSSSDFTESPSTKLNWSNLKPLIIQREAAPQGYTLRFFLRLKRKNHLYYVLL